MVIEDVFNFRIVRPKQLMPSIEEFNEKFTDFLNELQLPERGRTTLLNLDPEKKWTIYCTHKLTTDGANSCVQVTEDAEYHATKLRALYRRLRLALANADESFRREVFESFCEFLEDLKEILIKADDKFLDDFIEMNGLKVLTDMMKKFRGPIEKSILQCIKYIIRNNEQRSRILINASGIIALVLLINDTEVEIKTLALQILGLLCRIPEGHQIVFEAMEYFKNAYREQARFQSLVTNLDCPRGCSSVHSKIATMNLINTLIVCGHGKDHLEFRVHLQQEFSALGINGILEKLLQLNHKALTTHIQCFRAVKERDEDQLAKTFGVENVQFSSAQEIFQVLDKKVRETDSYEKFESILTHMLLLKFPNKYAVSQYFSLVDGITQYFVMESGRNTYDYMQAFNPESNKIVKIHLRKVIRLLETRNALKKAQEDLAEREEEIRTLKMELVEERKKNEKLLKQKSKDCNEFRYVNELDLSRRLMSGEDREIQGEKSNLSLHSTRSSASKLQRSNSLASSSPQFPKKTRRNRLKLNDPGAHAEMFKYKSKSVDDINAFQDLENTEYSASKETSKLDGDNEQIMKPINGSRLKKSLINSRRALNIEIFLKALKFTEEQITKALESLDANEELNADIVEHLIKLIPPKDECDLILQYKGAAEKLVPPDRFLRALLLKVPRYLHRLKCLYFRKTFKTNADRLTVNMRIAMEAIKEVKESERLKRILEILQDTNKHFVGDLDSSICNCHLFLLKTFGDVVKPVDAKSMLLVITKMIKETVPDLFNVKEDLPSLSEALKINVNEEIETIRLGLADAWVELQVDSRLTSSQPKDSFISRLSSFFLQALTRFKHLVEEKRELNQCYLETLCAYGGKNVDFTIEEFLDLINSFLISFLKTYSDINLVEQEERQDSEQNVKWREYLKKRRNQIHPISSAESFGINY